jgi:hypothetical protein
MYLLALGVIQLLVPTVMPVTVTEAAPEP